MKLIGKTKMEKLEAVLTALRKRAKLLTGRRGTAKAALDDALIQRQRHLLEGDVNDEKVSRRLQSMVDSCTSTLTGIDDALAALQAQTNDAEEALNAERLSVERKVAAEQIAANVATVERQIGPWLAASREIAAAFAKLDHVFEAGQIGSFITNAAGEVEIAAAVTLAELRNLPKAVADGSAPIPHRPEPGAPEPEPERLEQVFALHAVSWTYDGQQRRMGKWNDVELPREIAERALRLGICVPLSDPRRKQLVGQSPGHPEPHWCQDLDHEPDVSEPATVIGPITHTAFTPVDRGPGFQMKYSREG
jgi:hypothetical protein